MMQESVYTKLALNNSIVLSEKDKLKRINHQKVWFNF